MKKTATFITFLALASLSLSACADPQVGTPNTTDTNDKTTPSATFDINQIETVPEIAALVPAELKEKGILLNGASTDYAPAEFRAADGQTPIGYDIDITKALAKVMGLKEGQTQHAEFATIIPALDSKFNIGASSFTITPERLEQVNMISYVQVGSSYAVPKGNPGNFDPADVCGKTVGILSGTYQQEYMQAKSTECETAGKESVKIMTHDLNTDAITKLVGGQYDAVLSDSTVTAYAITQTNGKIEQVGEVIEAEPQGIVIAKDNQALSEVIQKAMQYLMDKGYLKQILDNYGAGEAALNKADLNPGK
ncbi:ABC transporter substrate-binding protein [Gleimia sp. 6138-11-ORH1]|nr:ABC transporter substrate-binding protein [Gleimia sp. 6138-11-ORH1]MCS4484261.1 ABC transporter substrate-binding protein [Gleimia sp. 6138-11-ORH1]